VPADLTARNIRTTDQYLELIAKAIFASGFSWAVVESRWPDLRPEFDRFSATQLALLDDVDIERLCTSPGVISNQRKISAVIEAARFLLDRKAEFGSVGRWLDGAGNFHERQKALRRMRFIGPFGSYFVLSVAGHQVPDYERWREEYAPYERTG